MTRGGGRINECSPHSNADSIDYQIGDLLDYTQPHLYIVKSEQYHPEYKTPVLTAGKTFVLGYTNETEGVYPASKANPVIIFDDFTGAIQWVDFSFKVKSSALKILTQKRADALLRYLWYLMLVKNFSSSTHARLWISTYSQFIFQIPPIHIQHKIVTVLDNFDAICSDLQIGLPAEINARQKQYEYYRDQLLVFAATGKPVISVSESNRGGVELIKLCQYVFGYAFVPMAFLFEFKGGLNRPRNTFGLGNVPFIKYLDVYKNRSLRAKDVATRVACSENEITRFKVNRGDVIFTCTSETSDEIAMASVVLDQISNCVFGGHLIKAGRKTDLLLPEYATYCFSDYVFRQFAKSHSTETIRASFYGSTLGQYLLPLPSIAMQQKIASMLDLFQELQTGAISGIQAEIDLRIKQYEYYRDFLLQFD